MSVKTTSSRVTRKGGNNAPGKTGTSSVTEILEQVTETNTLEQVREILNSGEPILKTFKDFGDPGREVDIGTESRVNCEDLGPLERIIPGHLNFLPAHFLEEGAVVQRAVARVNLNIGFGTGFLVSPSILMTNNHVLRTEVAAAGAKGEFNYQFDYSGSPLPVDSYGFDPNNLFYTNSALDFTIVRVKSKCRLVLPPLTHFRRSSLPGGAFNSGEESAFGDYTYEEFADYQDEAIIGGVTPGPDEPMEPTAGIMRQPRMGVGWRPYLRRVCRTPGARWGFLQLPRTVSYAGPTANEHGQHVNIIQHPRARRKEVALQDNTITNIYSERIRYRTDTEQGSSGSPIFNNSWDLLSIHHAAGERRDGSWFSNEGMRMDRIVDDIRAHFMSQPSGTQILTELRIL